MISFVVEKRQDNGRYKPDGIPVTDPAYVYKALSHALYGQFQGRCVRFDHKVQDDGHIRFVFTYFGWRKVFIVPEM